MSTKWHAHTAGRPLYGRRMKERLSRRLATSPHLHRLRDDVQQGRREQRARREYEGVGEADVVRHALVDDYQQPRETGERDRLGDIHGPLLNACRGFLAFARQGVPFEVPSRSSNTILPQYLQAETMNEATSAFAHCEVVGPPVSSEPSPPSSPLSTAAAARRTPEGEARVTTASAEPCWRNTASAPAAPISTDTSTSGSTRATWYTAAADGTTGSPEASTVGSSAPSTNASQPVGKG